MDGGAGTGHGGMVTPMVADQEPSVQTGDDVDEPTGLGVVHGDRLLEEYRDAGLEAFDGCVDVQGVRAGDDDRIQLLCFQHPRGVLIRRTLETHVAG